MAISLEQVTNFLGGSPDTQDALEHIGEVVKVASGVVSVVTAIPGAASLASAFALKVAMALEILKPSKDVLKEIDEKLTKVLNALQQEFSLQSQKEPHSTIMVTASTLRTKLTNFLTAEFPEAGTPVHTELRQAIDDVAASWNNFFSDDGFYECFFFISEYSKDLGQLFWRADNPGNPKTKLDRFFYWGFDGFVVPKDTNGLPDPKADFNNTSDFQRKHCYRYLLPQVVHGAVQAVTAMKVLEPEFRSTRRFVSQLFDIERGLELLRRMMEACIQRTSPPWNNAFARWSATIPIDPNGGLFNLQSPPSLANFTELGVQVGAFDWSLHNIAFDPHWHKNVDFRIELMHDDGGSGVYWVATAVDPGDFERKAAVAADEALRTVQLAAGLPHVKQLLEDIRTLQTYPTKSETVQIRSTLGPFGASPDAHTPSRIPSGTFPYNLVSTKSVECAHTSFPAEVFVVPWHLELIATKQPSRGKEQHFELKYDYFLESFDYGYDESLDENRLARHLLDRVQLQMDGGDRSETIQALVYDRLFRATGPNVSSGHQSNSNNSRMVPKFDPGVEYNRRLAQVSIYYTGTATTIFDENASGIDLFNFPIGTAPTPSSGDFSNLLNVFFTVEEEFAPETDPAGRPVLGPDGRQVRHFVRTRFRLDHTGRETWLPQSFWTALDACRLSWHQILLAARDITGLPFPGPVDPGWGERERARLTEYLAHAERIAPRAMAQLKAQWTNRPIKK